MAFELVLHEGEDVLACASEVGGWVDVIGVESGCAGGDEVFGVFALVLVAVVWVWKEDGGCVVGPCFGNAARAGARDGEVSCAPGVGHACEEWLHECGDVGVVVYVADIGLVIVAGLVDDLPLLACKDLCVVCYECDEQLIDGACALAAARDEECGPVGGEAEASAAFGRGGVGDGVAADDGWDDLPACKVDACCGEDDGCAFGDPEVCAAWCCIEVDEDDGDGVFCGCGCWSSDEPAHCDEERVWS